MKNVKKTVLHCFAAFFFFEVPTDEEAKEETGRTGSIVAHVRGVVLKQWGPGWWKVGLA